MIRRLPTFVWAPLLLLAGCASTSDDVGVANDAAADSGSRLPGLDSGVATDSGQPSNTHPTTADAAAGPFCGTPLGPDSGPATLDEVPIADWCTATSGRVVGWTCGGVTARVAAIGGDCGREYLFDPTSRKLVAVVGGCNGQEVCEAGDPGFQPPTECWSANASFAVTDVCAEAGLADAGPDGAGSACTSSAQCPSGFACVFSASEPCYSFGFCAFADFSHDPTCAPASYCACDGTMTQGCEGAYFLKPVPTRGGSAICGD